MSVLDHIEGQTFHGRRGSVENAFRYSIDYVMVDPEAELSRPALFGRNRRNLAALYDIDHGGPPGSGRGVDWVRDVLNKNRLHVADGQILLLAQPRMLGHVFNPVSFWLCHDMEGALRVVIAEVTNTFGDRHSYLCYNDDQRPITQLDTLEAKKIFHVSPFQPIHGDYTFRFDFRADRVGVWIDYQTGNEGVFATLTGLRQPLTSWRILRACFRRPFGSRRVLGLIHWQALKLWAKGAIYRARPEPPSEEVTR
ncbi:MAG: DUF1365 domain-containing protein [Pseudomonadota bacterium]